MISRRDALSLVKRYLRDEKLLKHVLIVEAIMKSIAETLGEDSELWGLTGLLHDIDYELVNRDMSRHGLVAPEILKDKVPDEIIDAIKAHNEEIGYKSSSKLALTLRIADHVSSLILATASAMSHKKARRSHH